MTQGIATLKAAVTGATGFLGSHLTSRLIQDGWFVSGLVRTAERADMLPATTRGVVGDICDRGVLDELVKGADVVFHTVSNFRTASGPPESYQHINVEGTRAALDASVAAGCKRFVHCSTIGVHGNVARSPADESAPFNPGDRYQETKLDAENYVRSQVGQSATEIVIIRPCSMYGPGDLRMLKMFRMLQKRTFFKVGPCRENFHAVYIDDIVNGFLEAATLTGVDGEVFIIGGESYVPLDEYIDTAATTVGAPPPFLRLPYPLLHGAAWLCEKTFVPLGLEPPLHIRRVRFFRNNRAFSIDKARRILGYEPKVGLAEGMRATVDWYRLQGLLPQQAATRN